MRRRNIEIEIIEVLLASSVVRKRRLIIFLAVGAALVALTVFAILAIVR